MMANLFSSWLLMSLRISSHPVIRLRKTSEYIRTVWLQTERKCRDCETHGRHNLLLNSLEASYGHTLKTTSTYLSSHPNKTADPFCVANSSSER